MKKKSYLTRAVLAMVASGMLYANVGFAATETKSASDITSEYTLNKGETLTLTGGVLAHNIVAGAQGKGDIILTAPLSVNTGVSITADIYGAKESRSTAIDGKSVSINGGTYIFADEFEGYDGIFGGKSTGSGDVTNNSIEFKSGTVNAPSSSDTHIENVLYGGLAEGNGNVTGNSVTVSGGTFTRTSVIGGKTQGKGNVNDNSVNISGGTFTGDKHNGIGGGTFLYEFNPLVTSEVKIGSANNNIVKITGGTFKELTTSEQRHKYMSVCGGLIEVDGFDDEDEADVTALKMYYTTGGASNNEVEIILSDAAYFHDIVGGSTFQGNANGNKVTVNGSGIVLDGGIAGGNSEENDVDILVNANGNILNLTNITVYADVHGGDGSGIGSTASSNEVHIFGGNYTNTHDDEHNFAIVGGSAQAKASANIVEIKDAMVATAGVVGGYIKDLGGIVKDNKVIIDNVTFNFDGDNGVGSTGTIVAGGFVDNTDGTFTGTRSGNSLEIGSKGFTVNTGKAVIIQNFDSMTFADGATVTNNGTLTFGNNGDDEAEEDVVWNARINGTGKVLVEGEITLNSAISNAGGIEIVAREGRVYDSDRKLRVIDAAYLGTKVTNTGSLNLYGGTLSQVVTNTNGVVKIKGDVATAGDKIVGGVLQVKDGGHLMLNNGTADVLVVDTFEAFDEVEEHNHDYDATDNKISFDAGTTVVDQVSATTYKGTITLGAVGLKNEFEGEVGTTVGTYQLFTGSSDYSQFKINGSAEAVMGTYKYVFSDNGSNDGKLRVYKDWGYSLHDIINNSDKDHKAGTVTSYSLNGDKTETEGLGTLTRTDSTKARELTINGNSYKLIAPTGITVNAGDTLTLKDVKYSVTSGNAISGAGTTNISGTVEVGGYVENKLAIAESSTLTIATANLGNTVVNKGVLALTGDGTLSKDITGSGTITNDGTLNIGSALNIGGNSIIGNKVVVKNATVMGDKSYEDKSIAGKNVDISDSSF